jgi:hypothetical protein
MVCSLAIQLAREGGYMLRVSGRRQTAVGSSRTGGRDAKHYATADALLRELREFGVGDDVLAAAERELSDPDVRSRFVKFAEDMQIPLMR